MYMELLTFIEGIIFFFIALLGCKGDKITSEGVLAAIIGGSFALAGTIISIYKGTRNKIKETKDSVKKLDSDVRIMKMQIENILNAVNDNIKEAKTNNRYEHTRRYDEHQDLKKFLTQMNDERIEDKITKAETNARLTAEQQRISESVNTLVAFEEAYKKLNHELLEEKEKNLLLKQENTKLAEKIKNLEHSLEFQKNLHAGRHYDNDPGIKR